MTSLATVLGVTPIALALGSASTSRIPMGIAIIGGLLFSLLLTLYVIPAIFTFFNRDKKVESPPATRGDKSSAKDLRVLNTPLPTLQNQMVNTSQSDEGGRTTALSYIDDPTSSPGSKEQDKERNGLENPISSPGPADIKKRESDDTDPL
jgi:hypothetical protein